MTQEMSSNRANTLRLVFVCTVMLVLTACGQEDTDTATEAEPSHPVRVGLMGLPPSLGNPYTSTGMIAYNQFWGAMFDGLTRIGPNQEVAPALAISWRQTDSETWAFNLRPDVFFANGEPFDSSAVAATIEWLKSPAGRATQVGDLILNVSDVEVIDGLNLAMRTTIPDPILPARLSGVPIVAPKAWQELGPDGFAQAPTGTGPFTLADWEGQAGARLVLHEQSWRKGNVKEIHFRAIPDSVARHKALLSGSIDIGGVDQVNLQTAQAADIQTVMAPNLHVIAPAFVTEGPGAENNPVRDVRVRQALNYAVNKQAIVEQLLEGIGEVSSQPAANASPEFNPDIAPYPYDPNRARSLLEEAGYASGFSLVLTLYDDSSPIIPSIYQMVAQDLRAVGVDAALRTIPLNNWREKFFSSDWDDAQMFSMSFIAQYTESLPAVRHFLCTRTNPFFCDASIDSAVADMTAQIDSDARQRKVKELMLVVHETAPALFLVDLMAIYGFAPGLTDVNVVNRLPVYESLRWAQSPLETVE